jgi:hypothetical protein
MKYVHPANCFPNKVDISPNGKKTATWKPARISFGDAILFFARVQ